MAKHLSYPSNPLFLETYPSLLWEIEIVKWTELRPPCDKRAADLKYRRWR
jgi:hypothetical protein